MAFFDFNLITDPPGDEFVDESVYWNANMDKFDTRLDQFTKTPNTVASPPVGTEALRSGPVIGVWTGSAWRVCDSIPASWSAWTALPLLAPVVERPGFTPQYRINTMYRRVELSGGLRAEVTAGPWSRTKVQFSANTGGIPDANKPVANSIQQGATGIGTTVGQYAGVRIWIESNAGNSVKLSASYQGDDIGGNFVMLDGIRWFY